MLKTFTCSLFILLFISYSYSDVITRNVANSALANSVRVVSQAADYGVIQKVEISVTVLFFSNYNPVTGALTYATPQPYNNFGLAVTGQSNPILLNTGTFPATVSRTPPGLVVFNFDDEALLSINDIKFPYSGSFRPNQPLSVFVGQSYDLDLTISVASAGNFLIVSVSLSVNCDTKTVSLLGKTSVPPILPNPQIALSYTPISNSRFTYDHQVNYYTGVNTRITSLLVSLFLSRATGNPANCITATPSAASADYSDAAIYLQFFPDNGPSIKFTLDTGVAAGISTSTWTSGTLFTTGFNYFIGLVANAPNTAANSGNYRTPFENPNLAGLAPYGRWVLTVSDSVADNRFWCSVNAQITIQTCISAGANQPCC